MDILLSWTYKCVEVGGSGGEEEGKGGTGGEERPDLPNSPLSLRESSLNHAQSHTSQLEFTRGLYVTNFLTLKSASSRGMKVCTNSSGPILASRS